MSPERLSSSQLIRYSRHLRLPGFGSDAQQKLQDSSVLIVGLGGLGCPSALYLAAAGIGTIGLADFDVVELHNLQRQILHTTASIGERKIQSATQRLQALNPDPKLVHHPEGVTVDNALELFASYDVILDGTDNFPTRYLCNDAAVLSGKPLVHGSIFQFEGQVAVFDSKNGTPCYRCLFPHIPPVGAVPNCDQAGVIGALCGIVGSVQAVEAIKLLTGLGDTLRGKIAAIDTLAMRWRTLSPPRDPQCPMCGKQPHIHTLLAENYHQPPCPTESTPHFMQSSETPEEIDIQSASAQLESTERPFLLDVREDFEYAIAHLAGTHHIPLGQLPNRWQELPQDQPIIVYCHHGRRSLQATQFLRDKGLAAACSMIGGIDQWSQQIDPSLPRY